MMTVRAFDSLDSFAAHLATVHVSLKIAEQLALEKCARIIESDAKAQIGNYQPSVGPFNEWDELAESTKADRLNKGYDPDEPLLRDGNLRDSIQHEVGNREAIIGSKSEIAAFQEFGTSSIPPRPFIGPAAFKSQELIQKIIGTAMVEGIGGGVLLGALVK